MKIQFNTDKTIDGDENQQSYFISLIGEKLNRYQSHVTRIEAHLSDQNGKKEGKNDIQCVLEARMEGRQPIAVTCDANSANDAVTGAIDKIKASLDTIIGKTQSSER
ncbi:HPF/RaiA family ribosome-associated protein [Flavobacterium sp.]